jgi:hypothetical protein
MLVRAGASINATNSNRKSALIIACSNRPVHADIAKYLVQAGSDLPTPIEIIYDKTLRRELVQIKNDSGLSIHSMFHRQDCNRSIAISTIQQ